MSSQGESHSHVEVISRTSKEEELLPKVAPKKEGIKKVISRLLLLLPEVGSISRKDIISELTFGSTTEDMVNKAIGQACYGSVNCEKFAYEHEGII